MQNSGYGKNGSDDVYSDSSLHMRFRIHLDEIQLHSSLFTGILCSSFSSLKKRITIPSEACYVIDFMDAALLVSKFSSS